MKIFIDSANLSDIREAFSSGMACGTTTNPAILAKEAPHPGGYVGHLRDILRQCPAAADHPFSIQPPIELLREAPRETVGGLRGYLLTKNLVVKIPVSWENMSTIRALAPIMPVNATCVFTAEQAIAAITAGAKYVSLFWGRINDSDKSRADENESQEEPNVYKPGGTKASKEARLIRTLLDSSGSHCQLLCGSIRTSADAREAFAAGAHIVTTGLPVLRAMANSELSDQSSAGFEEKRNAWEADCRKLAESEIAPEGGSGPQGPEPQPV